MPKDFLIVKLAPNYDVWEIDPSWCPGILCHKKIRELCARPKLCLSLGFFA